MGKSLQRRTLQSRKLGRAGAKTGLLDHFDAIFLEIFPAVQLNQASGQWGSKFKQGEGASSQQAAEGGLEGIVGKRRCIRLADIRLANESVMQPLNEMGTQILDDEDNSGPVIGVGPGVKPHGRMKNVLDAMDDQGPVRIVGERDDSLDPK